MTCYHTPTGAATSCASALNFQQKVSMNRAAYHVLVDTPAHKVHRLFRTMGLRHLVVTGELNEVKGIVTRADLIHHQH